VEDLDGEVVAVRMRKQRPVAGSPAEEVVPREVLSPAAGVVFVLVVAVVIVGDLVAFVGAKSIVAAVNTVAVVAAAVVDQWDLDRVDG